jgi:RND superfamily putative drug exporter
MDYHVLILSRVREAYDRGMSTERAVSTGIRATAGVVTSAAAVMVAVFGVFATLSTLDFKMMGIGLATAVLIDATVVRAVLLPASMKLLGDWNWYLPGWLSWLPEVAHEPPAPEPAPATEAAAELEIAVIRDNGRVSVTLNGELDAGGADRLGERLRAVEADSPKLMVIDMRTAELTDPAAIRELYGANRRARAEHRRLVVVESGTGEGGSVHAPGDGLETVADPAEIV